MSVIGSGTISPTDPFLVIFCVIDHPSLWEGVLQSYSTGDVIKDAIVMEVRRGWEVVLSVKPLLQKTLVNAASTGREVSVDKAWKGKTIGNMLALTRVSTLLVERDVESLGRVTLALPDHSLVGERYGVHGLHSIHYRFRLLC